MAALLLAIGVTMALLGLVILPVVAHVMLEAHSPRSMKRLALALASIVVNMGTATVGGLLIWFACTR